MTAPHSVSRQPRKLKTRHVRKRSIRDVVAIGVSGLAVASPPVLAQPAAADPPARFWLQAQPVSLQMKSDGRFPGSAAAQLGTPVQLEQQLGLSGRASATAAALTLRIGQRWRFEASYLDLDRSGQAVLGQDVDIGDFRFRGGTLITSAVSLRSLRINGGWSLVQDAQTEAGLMMGGRFVVVDSSFSGTGIGLGGFPAPAQGSTTPDRKGTFDFDTLPLLGGYLRHAIAPRWLVEGRLDTTLGSDRFTEGEFNGYWLPQRWLRLGLGYRYLGMRLNSAEVLTGSITRIVQNTQAHGPQLTLEARF